MKIAGQAKHSDVSGRKIESTSKPENFTKKNKMKKQKKRKQQTSIDISVAYSTNKNAPVVKSSKCGTVNKNIKSNFPNFDKLDFYEICTELTTHIDTEPTTPLDTEPATHLDTEPTAPLGAQPTTHLESNPTTLQRKKKSKRIKPKTSYNNKKSYKQTLDDRERELANSLFGDEAQMIEDDPQNLLDNFDDYFNQSNSFRDASTLKSNHEIGEDDASDNESIQDDLSEESKPKRHTVWTDDDENLRVCDVMTTTRSGKEKKYENELGNLKYKSTLKDKFTDVVGGIPEWADLDRELENDEEEMNRTTGTYLASSSTLKALPKLKLEYKPLPHFNSQSLSEGFLIKAVEFSEELNIALVAGCTRILGAVTLFQNDGKQNLMIHSIKFPKFPIKCARFLEGGKKFVVGSDMFGFFYVYDIEAGKRTEIPWNKSEDRNSMKNFEVSPDGKLLVFAGNGGEIYIYDAGAMGQIEMLRVPCEASAIAFDKDSTKLYTHGDNGRVYIFDLRSMKCIHSFYDEGCIKGTSIAISPNGYLLACGSSSGIVNVYNTFSVSSSINPKPLKAFDTLVTPVTSLKFNPTSEILAMASSFKDTAVKLIHTGSLTVFGNFPTAQNKMKRIQMVNFSPDSKYFVAGSNAKAAYQFRLFHY